MKPERALWAAVIERACIDAGIIPSPGAALPPTQRKKTTSARNKRIAELAARREAELREHHRREATAWLSGQCGGVYVACAMAGIEADIITRTVAT